jgi:hypothetical protein
MRNARDAHSLHSARVSRYKYELICGPQSDRVIIDRGRRVFAELPDYGELDGI